MTVMTESSFPENQITHEPALTPALYGLIGYPLGHSFSRAYFKKKFAHEGIDADYLNFELQSVDALPSLLDQYQTLRGLNVTIPHKQNIIPLLDELSAEARSIGAVNVVKIMREKNNAKPYLKGFNSDIIGFMESIRPLLMPHHKRALVLGTGGASKAICRGLEMLGLQWKYVSRRKLDGHFTYADLTGDLLDQYKVIVNCTPLGMSPRTDCCPELPYNALTPDHLLYDLVYNPEITLFMRNGRRYGAVVKNGLEMLHLQAEASWRFWNEENGKD